MNSKVLVFFFSNPKRVNEPQRVLLKASADVAENLYEDRDMKIIFYAARILRASVMKLEKWTFSGSLNNIDKEQVIPKPLFFLSGAFTSHQLKM